MRPFRKHTALRVDRFDTHRRLPRVSPGCYPGLEGLSHESPQRCLNKDGYLELNNTVGASLLTSYHIILPEILT